MTPGSKTRFEMLLSTKEHEMHHRSQLMLIERLLGMVPPPDTPDAGAHSGGVQRSGTLGSRRGAGVHLRTEWCVPEPPAWNRFTGFGWSGGVQVGWASHSRTQGFWDRLATMSGATANAKAPFGVLRAALPATNLCGRQRSNQLNYVPSCFSYGEGPDPHVYFLLLPSIVSPSRTRSTEYKQFYVRNGQ
jgi:hypothetical protein